jgi:hypothetical protein
MGQVNLNPPGDDRAGTGAGTVVMVLPVAFLVWAFAFNGMATWRGAPADSGPAASSPSTVNVAPSVNVNPPANTGGAMGGGATTSDGASGAAPAAPAPRP